MAKVKYGEMISDMRGKVNGTVHSKNQWGFYVRNKTNPIQPRTTEQMRVRTDMGKLAQSWRDLTDAERQLWNDAAINFKAVDVFGSSFVYTGFNLYMHLNRFAQEIGEPLLTTPPAPVGVFGFSSVSVDADAAANKLDLVFYPAIPATTKVIVYATPPLSAGKNFVRSEFRKLTVLTSADTSPVDLKSAYQSRFGSLGLAGQKVFVKVLTVDKATKIPGIPVTASDIF